MLITYHTFNGFIYSYVIYKLYNKFYLEMS